MVLGSQFKGIIAYTNKKPPKFLEASISQVVEYLNYQSIVTDPKSLPEFQAWYLLFFLLFLKE